MSKLTKRQRDNLSRIANKLYRNGVGDEHRTAKTYRRMSERLRTAGFHVQADALDLMAKGAETRKDILNEIVQDIREQIIVSQFTKETIVKGTGPLMGSRLLRRRK